MYYQYKRVTHCILQHTIVGLFRASEAARSDWVGRVEGMVKGKQTQGQGQLLKVFAEVQAGFCARSG